MERAAKGSPATIRIQNQRLSTGTGEKKGLGENICCGNPGRCSLCEWHGDTTGRFHHNVHFSVGRYRGNIKHNLGLITGIQCSDFGSAGFCGKKTRRGPGTVEEGDREVPG